MTRPHLQLSTCGFVAAGLICLAAHIQDGSNGILSSTGDSAAPRPVVHALDFPRSRDQIDVWRVASVSCDLFGTPVVNKTADSDALSSVENFDHSIYTVFHPSNAPFRAEDSSRHIALAEEA